MKKRKHKRKFSCEQDVKAEAKNIFNWYDVWYFMPQMRGMGRTSIPDFIACVRGIFLAVETKFDGRPATQGQLDEIDAIGKAKGVALIVDENNLDELEAVIKLIIERQERGE